jgi:valyl-tRNA synthetase
MARLLSKKEADAMGHCIQFTETVNSLRALLGIHPGQRVRVTIRPLFSDAGSAAAREFEITSELVLWAQYAMTMAKISEIEIENIPGWRRTVTSVLDWCEVGVETPEGFDLDKARETLKKQIDEVRFHKTQHEKRLANPDFIAKADPATREATQQRLAELTDKEIRLSVQLRLLDPGYEIAH